MSYNTPSLLPVFENTSFPFCCFSSTSGSQVPIAVSPCSGMGSIPEKVHLLRVETPGSPTLCCRGDCPPETTFPCLSQQQQLPKSWEQSQLLSRSSQAVVTGQRCPPVAGFHMPKLGMTTHVEKKRSSVLKRLFPSGFSRRWQRQGQFWKQSFKTARNTF